ncbi:MAG TPA: PHP domain-containing protein, partial [Candidatus Dormibacteraeota bacterium]|nr:PHP domain-containing protein [Candidatus Dormibacteraeota bacterium]
MGLAAIAITDHGGLYGMVRAHLAGERLGVRTLIGAELTLAPLAGIATPDPELLTERGATRAVRREESGRHHLTVLVRDAAGYRNLCRLLSLSNLAGRKGRAAVDWETLAEHAGGLYAFSGCKRLGLIPRLLREGRARDAETVAGRLRAVFARAAPPEGSRPATTPPGPERFLLELQNHLVPEDAWVCGELAELSRRTGIACVATNNVHLRTAADKPVQDVLVCIRERLTLDAADAAGHLSPNAERRLKTRAEMEAALLGPTAADGRPAIALEPWLSALYREALDRTVAIAADCDWKLDLRAHRFPGFRVPDGETPQTHLRRLCLEGAETRYPVMTETVMARIDRELDVIAKTGLAEFFLINWDLMRFAREQRIPGQGRGSAADSIVAYLLGITRVDPVRHKLLFERFLHEEQRSTPDIDIDFASSRREEVIRYIYDTYGYERTGMVANVVTFRSRMAIREAGRAMGFSDATLARLAGSLESRYPEEAPAAARGDVTDSEPA